MAPGQHDAVADFIKSCYPCVSHAYHRGTHALTHAVRVYMSACQERSYALKLQFPSARTAAAPLYQHCKTCTYLRVAVAHVVEYVKLRAGVASVVGMLQQVCFSWWAAGWLRLQPASASALWLRRSSGDVLLHCCQQQ